MKHAASTQQAHNMHAAKVQAEPSKQSWETEKTGDTEDEHCQLNNSCQLLQLQAKIVAYYMLAREHPLPNHVILAVTGSIFDKTDVEYMSLWEAETRQSWSPCHS